MVQDLSLQTLQAPEVPPLPTLALLPRTLLLEPAQLLPTPPLAQAPSLLALLLAPVLLLLEPAVPLLLLAVAEAALKVSLGLLPASLRVLLVPQVLLRELFHRSIYRRKPVVDTKLRLVVTLRPFLLPLSDRPVFGLP